MRFGCANRKAGINTANSPMWMIRSATTDSVKVEQVALSVAVAPTGAPEWLLYKLTASLGTATTQVTPVCTEGADAATARLDTVWSVAPTIPAVEIDGYATPASVGSGIVFSFGNPLILAPSQGLLIVNAIAAGATLGSFRCAVRIDE